MKSFFSRPAEIPEKSEWYCPHCRIRSTLVEKFEPECSGQAFLVWKGTEVFVEFDGMGGVLN